MNTPEFEIFKNLYLHDYNFKQSINIMYMYMLYETGKTFSVREIRLAYKTMGVQLRQKENNVL